MTAATKTLVILPASKPVVRVRDTYVSVKHRGHEGCLIRDDHRSMTDVCAWSGTVWGPRDESGMRAGQSVTHRQLTQEDAFAELIAHMDSLAICDALAVLIDKAEARGARKSIEQLGGAAALAVYDAACKQILAHDIDGRTTVEGMLVAVSGKKLPIAQTIIVSDYMARTTAVDVIPGFSVTLRNASLTYFIGETAEYDSYNLHYFGTIIAISTKVVAVDPRHNSRTRRLKLAQFVSKNDRPIGEKEARNSDTMQYI
jgi:hypothetical protein